jgi:hypothetical protein
VIYEKLDPDMQGTVDAYVRRLTTLDWRRRGELLAQAGALFGDDFGPEQSALAAKGFVTAVIERLGAPAVDDPFQANLYLASLDPAHRAEAERFLAENPQFQTAGDGEPAGEA